MTLANLMLPMATLPQPPRRPWLPWARVGLVALLVSGAGYGAAGTGPPLPGAAEADHRTGDHLAAAGAAPGPGPGHRRTARAWASRCSGSTPRAAHALEAKRWVKDLLIRRDPPDRLSLVMEERQPVLWLARPKGVFLVSDDGIVLDRLNQVDLMPIPVVADPKSQTGQAHGPADPRRHGPSAKNRKNFYDRITELRWSDQGPVAFLEGLEAPIYLSRQDATKNMPNFQMLFLNRPVQAAGSRPPALCGPALGR